MDEPEYILRNLFHSICMIKTNAVTYVDSIHALRLILYFKLKKRETIYKVCVFAFTVICQ